MPKDRRFWALTIVGAAILFLGWAMNGDSPLIPPQGQICDKAEDGTYKNCTTHHIALVAGWKIAEIFDQYSDAISAFSALAVALFTLGLFSLTSRQIRIADRAEAHFRVSERAYVTLSHRSPPGLIIDEKPMKDGSGHKVIANMAVANKGGTPAHVTDIVLELAIEIKAARKQVPALARPDREDGPLAFLTADGSYTATFAWELAPDDYELVSGNMASLYLTGYVDYVDMFWGRWRSGYERWYMAMFDGAPPEIRNNLKFVPYSRHHYDEARAEGVGVDWAWFKKKA